MRKRIVALAAMFATTLAAQTFRIAGTVVDSESAAPLGRTRVSLTGGPVPDQSIITSGDGKFSFDVPEGTYNLLAAHRGVGVNYGQPPSGSAYSSIITGRGQDTTNLALRWQAPVAIHGTVRDDFGEPVHGAMIELFVEAVSGGKKRMISKGRAESDEFGNYSWSSIPGGTYYLAATGAPWYFFDPNARQILSATGYAITYFPGGTDPRSATPLILRPGAELQADIALRSAKGSILRFACPNSPCPVGSPGTELEFAL